MRGIKEVVCVFCKRNYMKSTEKSSHRSLGKGIRGIHSVTCKKECSRSYMRVRQNRDYKK